MGGKKPMEKQRNCAKLCVNKFKADEISETKWMDEKNEIEKKNKQPANSAILCSLRLQKLQSGKNGKKLFHYVYNYIFSGIQVFDMVYVDVS